MSQKYSYYYLQSINFFPHFEVLNKFQMEEETITSVLKVLFMVLFFVVVWFVGTLPITSKAFKTNPKLHIFGSTFAGALFINVAILHILPESADTLEEYLRDGKQSDDGQQIEVFPLANLLLMLGFLITVFFTKIMAKHEHLPHQISGHSGQRCQSEQKNENHESQTKKDKERSDHAQIQPNQLMKEESDQRAMIQKKKKPALKQAYVLTIAIYFHTLFEGIAIGVNSKLSLFLGIAVAITFHKWADALSMGCHYKAKNIPKKTANLLIIGQAILNVLAIGFGWIISLEGEVVEAVFLSLSAGTFLAISTMELLTEQLHHHEYRYQKFILLILSTGFISCVWFVQNQLF